MVKGEIKMPTKLLDKEEILPANSLRTLSQKSLMEMVINFDKLGLIINNNLSIAMLSWDKYEVLVDIIDEQNKKIAELENVIEDINLVAEYGEDILRVERDESKSYQVDTTEELFNLLEK